MRKTLEDLYYGNITPNEQRMTPGSEMEKAVTRVAKCEEQLMGLLNEEGQYQDLRWHPENRPAAQHSAMSAEETESGTHRLDIP